MKNGCCRILGFMPRSACSPEKQMAAIVNRLNAIGDNPLHQNETIDLQRAYTAAVVQYFNARRHKRQNRDVQRGTGL